MLFLLTTLVVSTYIMQSVKDLLSGWFVTFCFVFFCLQNTLKEFEFVRFLFCPTKCLSLFAFFLKKSVFALFF